MKLLLTTDRSAAYTSAAVLASPLCLSRAAKRANVRNDSVMSGERLVDGHRGRAQPIHTRLGAQNTIPLQFSTSKAPS